MLRSAPLLALTLVACGGGYNPDSFGTTAIFGEHAFPGTRFTQGCLDIALRAQESLEGDPTLDVSLGNRCVEARRIHLQRLQVHGYYDGKAPRRLGLFDPRNEIRSALLGGRAAAYERFEVVGAQGAFQLCVSLDEVQDGISGPPTETCVPMEPGDEA